MYIHKILTRYIIPLRDLSLPNSPTVYKIIKQIKKLQEHAEVQANYDITIYFIINVIMSCNTLDQLECAKEWGLRLVKENIEMSVIVRMIIDNQYTKLVGR